MLTRDPCRALVGDFEQEAQKVRLQGWLAPIETLRARLSAIRIDVVLESVEYEVN